MADANTAARGAEATADASASSVDASEAVPPVALTADASATSVDASEAVPPTQPTADASATSVDGSAAVPPTQPTADASASPDEVSVEGHGPAGYLVNLEVFTGPFDLLLQLISRRRLDITEVDLADITADFLASLKGIDQLDLESATHFLVVAATLVELKAARLLPREQAEELEDLLGEARDLLYARLLEYRAFRDVAHDLNHRMSQHVGHHGRAVPLDPEFRRLVPDADLHITIDGLARLAALATAPRPEPTVRIDHIRRTFITIQQAAQQVLDKVLTPGDRAAFSSVVKGQRRADAIVFFLAMLELYKLGHLDLDQPDHRGELVLARREAATDLSVLAYLTTSGDPDDDLSPSDDLSPDDERSDDDPEDARVAAAAPPADDAPAHDMPDDDDPADDVAARTPEHQETL